MLVQVAVANPACNCAARAGTVPCQKAPAETGRRGCCSDSVPVSDSCSATMAMACCKARVVADEARSAALLPESTQAVGEFVQLPVVSEPVPAIVQAAFVPVLIETSDSPAWLRHAALLL